MTRSIRVIFIASVPALAAMLKGQAYPPGFPLGARIPAISGRVVDALTGKPVANIEVTLRATAVGRETLRRETIVTSARGEFAFKTSLEPELQNLLTSMEGYWLTVNHTFGVAGKTNTQSGDNSASDFSPDDLSWEILGDPLFNARGNYVTEHGLAGPRVSSPAYFPMAIQFVHPCKQTWNANCLLVSQTEHIRVPLLPVLDDPAKCASIEDQALSEQCRQLNTYRAAFVHVETIPEVRADKDLCRRIDDGPITKACLEHLAGYVQNAMAFEHRAPLRMEVDPIERVLILGPGAGFSLSRTSIHSLNPFWETAGYTACYKVKDSWLDAACAIVLWSGTEEGRRNAMVMGGKGHETTETIEGNRITTLDSADQFTALWASGPRVVRIIFYNALYWRSGASADPRHFKEASPEARHQLLQQYLAKYPSSR